MHKQRHLLFKNKAIVALQVFHGHSGKVNVPQIQKHVIKQEMINLIFLKLNDTYYLYDNRNILITSQKVSCYSVKIEVIINETLFLVTTFKLTTNKTMCLM